MDSTKSKSVLDNIPVKESGFPPSAKSPDPADKPELLVRVGACSKCNAPIYGPEEVLSSDPEPIPVRWTCTCAGNVGMVGTK